MTAFPRGGAADEAAAAEDEPLLGTPRPVVVAVAVPEDEAFCEAGTSRKKTVDNTTTNANHSTTSSSRSSRNKFKPEVWAAWVWTRYREPFDAEDVRAAAAFWYVDCSEKPSTTTAAWVADLFAFPNWTLCGHYWAVGVALNLLSTPVTYYLVESLGASAAVVNTYNALLYLPWCLKIFFGLQSDLRPWLGMHRRSYFMLGWLIFLGANVWLAVCGRPGVAATLLLSFAATFGCLLADTVADAMILECSRKESPERDRRGRMRTHAYVVRQLGAFVGSLVGALIYNSRKDGGTWTWGLSVSACFWLQAAHAAVSVAPWLPFAYELPGARCMFIKPHNTTNLMMSHNPSAASSAAAPSTLFAAERLFRDAYDFVSLDGVWVPLFYLYFYCVCFVQNASWYNFLYDGLGFSAFQVGLLYAVGSLLSVAGLKTYERYFFASSWRSLYLWTTVVGAIFSFLQVLLVTGDTFGLPRLVFATGDISMQEFIQNLAFMPICIMFFAMIPPGTEGTTYALITTWTNVASEVAYNLGTPLACTVDVSNRALSNGRWAGVLKLTLITSGTQLLPAFFVYARTPSGVWLMPDNVQETRLQCAGDPPKRSRAGANAFFIVFCGSILVSLGGALYVVFHPSTC